MAILPLIAQCFSDYHQRQYGAVQFTCKCCTYKTTLCLYWRLKTFLISGRALEGVRGCGGAVLGAAFNNAILCWAVVADSLLCCTYAAPACQTGSYYDAQRGRTCLRQLEQLQRYLEFSYFLTPSACTW